MTFRNVRSANKPYLSVLRHPAPNRNYCSGDVPGLRNNGSSAKGGRPGTILTCGDSRSDGDSASAVQRPESAMDWMTGMEWIMDPL